MNMKKFFIGLATASILILPAVALAQNFQNNNSQPNVTNNNNPPAQSVGTGNTSFEVKNPLKVDSFCGLIKHLLQAVLDIGIPVAILFIVYAGFKFILARGNSEKLVEARQNLLYVLIGIGIFLGAWLLAQVIANTVNAVAGNNNALVSCK